MSLRSAVTLLSSCSLLATAVGAAASAQAGEAMEPPPSSAMPVLAADGLSVTAGLLPIRFDTISAARTPRERSTATASLPGFLTDASTARHSAAVLMADETYVVTLRPRRRGALIAIDRAF